MKKHLKRLAATYKYVFRSNWGITVEQTVHSNYVYDETTYNEDPLYSDSEVQDAAVEFFKNSWKEEKEVIDQFLYEHLGIPTQIDLEIDGPEIITNVLTKQKLTDEQIDSIKDYLAGQFSDGFGEGWEQEAFYKYDNRGDADENYPKISDTVDFEKWCDIEGNEIPEEGTEEYDELYDEYESAEDFECTTERVYFFNLWPENFKMELVDTKEE